MSPYQFPLFRKPKYRDRGFTLVELLVVAAIIGVMSSAVVFAMFGMMEEGRINRTKTQIARIDAVIGERWETYRIRSIPIPIPPSVPSSYQNASYYNSNYSPKYVAQVRLAVLRALMRTELPERITDITDDANAGFTGSSTPALPPISASANAIIPIPSLQRRYRRQATNIVGGSSGIPNADYTWKAGGGTAPTGWTAATQESECLFLILDAIRAETGNPSILSSSEIGDTDGDKMQEVLDAWGNPIMYIRWPCGMGPPWSSRQASWTARQTTYTGPTDPDTFDISKVGCHWSSGISTIDENSNSWTVYPFRTYPLICSYGPDGALDIVTFANSFHYSTTASPDINDPYVLTPSGDPNIPAGSMAGLPIPKKSGYLDNITNHLIEVK